MSEEEAEEYMSDGEAELHFSVEGLGQFHEIDGEPVFVKSSDSLSCLRDVLRAIRRSNESAEEVDRNRNFELRLAEWETVPKRLVPMFLFYREDTEIVEAVLKVLVILTRPLSRTTENFPRLLRFLQDYKQQLADTNVMTVLMALLIDAVKLQELPGAEVPAEKRAIANRRVELVMALVKNLLAIPDARPADAGYVPGREHLGLKLVTKLQEEGLLDLFVLFSESSSNVWLMFETFYGLLTQTHPRDLLECTNQRKPNLAKLLEQNLSLQRADVPLVFRHSRFGPQLLLRKNLHATRQPPARRRQYDQSRVQGERLNVFQDRAFVDLKQRRPGASDAGAGAGPGAGGDTGELWVELRRFFELFIESSLTHVLGGVVRDLHAATLGNEGFAELDYVRLFNVFAWTLEFQRLVHRQSRDAAGETVVEAVDVAAVQWCVNEQAVGLVLRQLKKETKEAKSMKLGGAMVVVVLRALLEQLRMVDVLGRAKLHRELQEVGREIFANIMYDDVIGLLLWVVKNYAPTAHDPRVLQLALESLAALVRAAETLDAAALGHGHSVYVTKHKSRKGGKTKKHSKNKNKSTGTVPGQHSSASSDEDEDEGEGEVEVRATSFSAERVIGGLTHKEALKPMVQLVHKFRENGKELNKSLAFLFYRVMRLSEEAVGIFFQLSTLVIFRDFLTAPEIRVPTAESRNYSDLVAVVREIVRKFLLALGGGSQQQMMNRLMPLELLFPRTFNELELKGLLSHYADPAVRDWLVQGGANSDEDDERDDDHADSDSDEAEILRIFHELRTASGADADAAETVDRRQFHRLVAMVGDVLGRDDDGDRVRVVLARHGIVPPSAGVQGERRQQQERQRHSDEEDEDEEARDWRGFVFSGRGAAPQPQTQPQAQAQERPLDKAEKKKQKKARKLAAEVVGLLGRSLDLDERALLGSAVLAKYRL